MTTVPINATEPAAPPYAQHTKTISLAGKEWPVPLLAPRQNRIVMPAALQLFKVFKEYMKHILELKRPNITDDEKFDVLAKMALSKQEHALLEEVIYAALTRAHPKMTMDEFIDMPIATNELVVAFWTVVQQSKGLAGADLKDKPAQGEA